LVYANLNVAVKMSEGAAVPRPLARNEICLKEFWIPLSEVVTLGHFDKHSVV